MPEMMRYHFEVRTAGSRFYPDGATFTPAYYAESLEEAERQARRNYPSALRVILVDVDRGYLRGGDYRINDRDKPVDAHTGAELEL